MVKKGNENEFTTFYFEHYMKILFSHYDYILIISIRSQGRKERELWKDDIAPQVKHNGRDLYKSPLYNKRMYSNQSESGPQGRTLSTIAGRYLVRQLVYTDKILVISDSNIFKSNLNIIGIFPIQNANQI